MSLIFAINCFNNGKVNCTIHQNCLLWNGRQIRIFKDKGQAECSELSFQQGKLPEIALQLHSLDEILGVKTHSTQTKGIVPNHRSLTKPKQGTPYWTICDALLSAQTHTALQLALSAVETLLEHVCRTPVTPWVQFISWLFLCTTRPDCAAAWTCQAGAAHSLDLGWSKCIMKVYMWLYRYKVLNDPLVLNRNQICRCR